MRIIPLVASRLYRARWGVPAGGCRSVVRNWVLALLFVIGPLEAEEVWLGFRIADGPTVDKGLTELRVLIPERELEFVDPMYGEKKRYRALPLDDVVRVGFGEALERDEYGDIVFTALDGYTAIAGVEQAGEPGGYLVFEDLDFPGWEPVGRKRAVPAPFYVVWTGGEQSTAKGYPWPWQLRSLTLSRFRDLYPKVYPEGARDGSAAMSGFRLFKRRCFRCHALGGQGGKVGPDLNAPRNILSQQFPLVKKV